MSACVRDSDRVEQRWDHRRKPAVAPHRVDQIEHELRIAAFQCVKVVEVKIDGHDLGGKAELGDRAGHRSGGHKRIDLIWTMACRGVHDGYEAAWLERHQARLRSRSWSGRASP